MAKNNQSKPSNPNPAVEGTFEGIPTLVRRDDEPPVSTPEGDEPTLRDGQPKTTPPEPLDSGSHLPPPEPNQRPSAPSPVPHLTSYPYPFNDESQGWSPVPYDQDEGLRRCAEIVQQGKIGEPTVLEFKSVSQPGVCGVIYGIKTEKGPELYVTAKHAQQIGSTFQLALALAEAKVTAQKETAKATTDLVAATDVRSPEPASDSGA